MLKYEVQIAGIVDDGFTSAQILEEGSDRIIRAGFSLWLMQRDDGKGFTV